MKRRGKVFMHSMFAGVIEQDEDEFVFQYDASYLKQEKAQPVSLTLPLKSEPYVLRTLFPFFDGLIPEGWLLEVASKNWKIDSQDRMGLLLAVCQDCVGAVHVEQDSLET